MKHLPMFGVGFRTPHFETICAGRQPVDWFEIVTESFLGVGGPRRAMLARLRADYPIILHGVGLSIAGTEPLSRAYLDGLRALAEWLEPPWVSDHLCWTGRHGRTSHDLLPVAYTRDVLDHVAARVEQVQDVLQRRLLLENASAYVAFRASDMDEAELFATLCARTGCGMLLDVNNLYVNAANLGTDPVRYLEAIPADRVGYLHVAGHAVLPDVRIDTHDEDVPAAVWQLFEAAVRRCPGAGVVIERDDNLPAFADLLAEVDEARARHAAALAAPSAAAPFETPPKEGGSSEGRTGKRCENETKPVRAEEAPSSQGPSRSPLKRLSTLPGGEGTELGAGGAEQDPGFCSLSPRERAGVRGPDAGEALNWASQQEALWQRLVDKPVGFDHGADATLARWLDDRRPVATARGLRVYSDAYATNLRRALAVNFPALARVVSVADFDGMAAAYVRKHPPRGHDFRDLGAHLAAFVRAYPFAETYGVAPEVLAELVAVEQAQIEVLDAVDETPAVAALDLAALDAAQWETARFRFASAVRLVPVTHDVLPVIEAVGRGETPVRPAAIEGAYLVCRAGTALRTERLQAHEAACFAALLEGRSFGAACEVAASDPSADPAAVATDAVRLLVTACARGLLLGVELDGTD